MVSKRLLIMALLLVAVFSLCPMGADASASEMLQSAGGVNVTGSRAGHASSHDAVDGKNSKKSDLRMRKARQVRRSQHAHKAIINKMSNEAMRICKLNRSVKVHRLYNVWSGEHLYTANAVECAYLVGEGWLREGSGWAAPLQSDTPVYCLYNPQTGKHLFTASKRERRVLTKRQGWNDEGVACYSDSEFRRVPVYRLHSPWGDNYVFTTDKRERGDLIREGWEAEGIGWYAAASGVPAGSMNYRIEHWRYFLDSANNDSEVTVQNGSISPELRERLGEYTRTGVPVGFIAINKRTGKTIASSPDYREFSASTMKAVYATALCKYGAPDIAAHAGQLYNALTYSSNEDYNSLYYTYGISYLHQIMAEACVSPDLRYSQAYADVTPRELAKLWLVISDYLQEPGPNADLLRSSFGLGAYYKEGWMESGTWSGQLYNLAGVQGDVVYAVVSRWGRPSASMWNLRDDLLAALE